MLKPTRPLLAILVVGLAPACADVADVAANADTDRLDVQSPSSLRSALADTFDVDDSSFDVAAPIADADELAAFRAACATVDPNSDDDGTRVVPPAPSIPASTSTLPAVCDEGTRLTDVIAACGPLTPSTGDSLEEALAGCVDGTTCHITLPAGDFDGGAELGCVVLEGAGLGATRVHGGLGVYRDSVIARLSIDDDYGALTANANLLVTEAGLSGGYEGLSISWEADFDVAVCRSQIAAGYGGAGQSWASHKLTVAGSAVAACYEAVSSSWGSQQLHVQENVLFAGYVGVDVHHSLATVAVANAIFSENAAVGVTQWDLSEEAASEEGLDGGPDYTPEVIGVLVAGNTILGGTLPESDLDRAIEIQ